MNETDTILVETHQLSRSNLCVTSGSTIYYDTVLHITSATAYRDYMLTVMLRLATGIPSEKWVVRRFRRCANVIECTYTNLDSIAHYTPRLYSIAYCS